jgi:histidinol dehydrogenase
MTRSLFRIEGALDALPTDALAVLFERATSNNPKIRDSVTAILADVRTRGDAALRELGARHDGVALEQFEVPRSAWREALAATPEPLREAMTRAARNLRVAHEAWRPREERVTIEPGLVLGRRPDPLACVGVYAPGGRAVYPSSVLMGAIPARVAGVGEVVLCTPPQPEGRPAPAVLAAAELAGVDRVFAIGGAGAIAALAYGTATVPRVDRIVGPGNAWVAEAKLQVANTVGIDSPAGPSEVLVIADATSDPAFVARELVAQAEHDPRACAVALVIGADPARMATSIGAALESLVAASPRSTIVREALAGQGALVTTRDLPRALEFVARYAPEHLVLAVEDAEALLPQVRHAGTVFVGPAAANAFGDYLTGGNHVLPTGGAARVASGLSTLDFVRWTTWQSITPGAAAALADDVAVFAMAEGLPGHAAAAAAWRAHA